jgi:dipeptidyl aminopeptidase/acylaminoacyl peptidase
MYQCLFSHSHPRWIYSLLLAMFVGGISAACIDDASSGDPPKDQALAAGAVADQVDTSAEPVFRLPPPVAQRGGATVAPRPAMPPFGNVILTSATTPRTSPLPPAEAARLERLTLARTPTIASELSPDGTRLVVDRASVTAFTVVDRVLLNVLDGTETPLPEAVVAAQPESLGGSFSFTWASRDVLAYLERPAPPQEAGAAQAASQETSPPPKSRVVTRQGWRPRPSSPRATAGSTRDGQVTRLMLVTVNVRTNRVVKQAVEIPGTLVAGSPGLARLLVQGADGNERQLSLLDLRSGGLSPLAELPAEAQVSSTQWSRHRDRVAVVLGWQGSTDIGPFADLSGPSRLLISQADPEVLNSLGRLAPERNPMLTKSRALVFDLRSRQLIQTIEPSRRSPRTISRVTWTPSGASLLVTEAQAARLAGRRHPIAQEVTAGAEHTMLAVPSGAVRFRIGDPAPTRPVMRALPVDDDTVLLQVMRQLDSDVVLYHAADQRFETVAQLDGALAEGAPMLLDRQREQLLFSSSSYARPPELRALALSSHEVWALTDDNHGLAELARVRAERVTFTLEDGARRTGYWVAPATAAFPPTSAQPVVIWQQGGPGGVIFNKWAVSDDDSATALAASGIATLVVPLSGRANDGWAVESSLFEETSFGQRDIGEAAQIVRQLMARGWVAPRKAGVAGCSYGGYFAAQSAVRFPELYGAANPQCGVYDFLWTWQLDSKALVALIEGKTPGEAPSEYIADSPLYNVARIRTPMLISHGDLDSLPVHGAQQFHDELASRDLPVTLLRFTDEFHGLGDESNNRFGLSHQIAFFRRQLLGHH